MSSSLATAAELHERGVTQRGAQMVFSRFGAGRWCGSGTKEGVGHDRDAVSGLEAVSNRLFILQWSSVGKIC